MLDGFYGAYSGKSVKPSGGANCYSTAVCRISKASFASTTSPRCGVNACKPLISRVSYVVRGTVAGCIFHGHALSTAHALQLTRRKGQRCFASEQRQGLGCTHAIYCLSRRPQHPASELFLMTSSIDFPLGALVRFSYPSRVTRMSSSILTPPTFQYRSSTSLSMN